MNKVVKIALYEAVWSFIKTNHEVKREDIRSKFKISDDKCSDCIQYLSLKYPIYEDDVKGLNRSYGALNG